MSIFYKISITALFIFAAVLSRAQTRTVTFNDTTRLIEIIRANNMRHKTTDSASLEILAGQAAVRQGNTRLEGDSIIMNEATGVAEVFGSVHINDADSVNTYSHYLKYIGSQRIAYLKKDVKLTDGKAVLYTDEMEYNLATGIAKYTNGGRVVNGSTVLTSEDAVYYSDTKDVYFKKNVHLVDPKYDIRADSLLYNTQLQIATFISPTHIISKDGTIDTRSGTYNLKTGEAIFYDRTAYRDSTHSITGDKMAYDEKTGIIQIEGNGKMTDSVNKVTVVGGEILLDKKNNSFLATRKPVMILYRDNDSTYIAADTLFSGLRRYDSATQKQVTLNDTLQTITAVNLSDSSKRTNTLNISDSLVSAVKPTPVSKDSVRYFLGFHHVRIFNDSLQAVSDSLHYSTEDSTFRLLGEPVFWNGKTQVSGDTIYMYTENQKPKRLNVFNNGMIVNEANPAMYNQIGGRTLNGYFKEGTIDYIRAKGSPAESIFYPQDADSAYIGMNRSDGDVIDIFFVQKELNKVKFVNNVNGTLYPLKQIPAELKYLKNFKWMDKRRPKNKLELFE